VIGAELAWRLRREAVTRDEFFADGDFVGLVHQKHLDGGSTDGGEADGERAVPAKVLGPAVGPWMKEAGHLSGNGVDAGDVWTLVAVASATGQGEIVQVVIAAVLSRQDVLDVEAEASNGLRKDAVFAGVGGSRADRRIEALVGPRHRG